MTKEHIDHGDIVSFADEHVNLKRADAKKYRDQVNGPNGLRNRLCKKLQQETNFVLRRMMLSGSLAKGSALKQINDMDVAVYVRQDDPPREMPEFIERLVQTLRTLYPNMSPDQITPQEHSVRMSFRGTGLDVDIVPVSYDGNSDWDGHLYSTRQHEWVLTNIEKHLEFIGKRKRKWPSDFIQIVRLLKYWVRQVKKRDDDFRFKSLLVELLLAHLADNGRIELSNHVDVLADFFNYIVRGGLDETIVFDDYYPTGRAGSGTAPIKVYDPVNPDNNVADGYDARRKAQVIRAAGEAADAIDAALYAPTRSETVRYWQKVFGPSFGG